MTIRFLRRGLRHLAASALLAAGSAQAGYFQWEMVELPPQSGAACGNGSPYRFFVNRTPFSADIAITYEGVEPAGIRGHASARGVSQPAIRTGFRRTTWPVPRSASAW